MNFRNKFTILVTWNMWTFVLRFQIKCTLSLFGGTVEQGYSFLVSYSRRKLCNQYVLQLGSHLVAVKTQHRGLVDHYTTSTVSNKRRHRTGGGRVKLKITWFSCKSYRWAVTVTYFPPAMILRYWRALWAALARAASRLEANPWQTVIGCVDNSTKHW